jgi:hypothetical protein
MRVADSPLFAKAYDLLAWLIPATLNFPKSHRFVLARYVRDAAWEFYGLIIEARKMEGAARKEALLRADVELEKLRLGLRLCSELRLLSMGQYEHASRMVVEVGSLLGAWVKQTAKKEETGNKGGVPALL